LTHLRHRLNALKTTTGILPGPPIGLKFAPWGYPWRLLGAGILRDRLDATQLCKLCQCGLPGRNLFRRYTLALIRIFRWLALATFLLGTQGHLSLAAESPKPSEHDLQSILNDGVLRVAMTRFDLPAFHQTRSDGSVVGLEADLSRALAEALKVKVSIRADYGSFDAVAEAVASGHEDIGLSKLSQTYYRVLHVRFSQPYVTLHHALLYDRNAIADLANGNTPEEVLRSFRGKIGVIAKSAYVDFGHRNFPEAEIVPLGTWDEVILALKERRVGAIYRDEFEIHRVLKSNPVLNIHFGAAIVTDQKAFLSIAICDTCSKLQQFINYHLTEYPTVYTVDQLLDLANQK
jgi:polar amino acid transport system substrate-binding protein